jgi:hypothetical protein
MKQPPADTNHVEGSHNEQEKQLKRVILDLMTSTDYVEAELLGNYNQLHALVTARDTGRILLKL